MKIRELAVIAACAAAGAAWAERTAPATFYVDSKRGRDEASGLSEKAAWQSLEKVNDAELIPGDRVLFRRGGLWRGQLVPQSGSNGAPIVYGAYGKGEKPIIENSVAREKKEQWRETAPGLWSTRPFEPEVFEQIVAFTNAAWGSSFQELAKGKVEQATEDGHHFQRLTCAAPGNARHQIQLWGPLVENIGPCAMLRLRMRSTQPFQVGSVEVTRSGPPWTTAASGALGKQEVGPAWKTFDVLLLRQEKDVSSPRLHLSLGGVVPAGAVFDIEPLGVWRASLEKCEPIAHDVGILILSGYP